MKKLFTLIIVQFFLFITVSLAQNPIVRDQFTADPSARSFNGKVYVYPSHDIIAEEGKGREGWFCMEDYHVFSSENLTDWEDHGVIVSQKNVEWANPDSYSMWAPDCVEKNGKYYFYFPTLVKDSTIGRGFGIGVAVADKPEGPFVPQAKPIKGIFGIDPNILIDKDGQAYIYWSMRELFVAKLKDNMIELASEPQVIKELPSVGLKEGPWMFERNGIYYMTYPHVNDKIERLEYAIGDNPMGPFKYTGVIMDESPMNCWTNHLSIMEHNGQWYLFYHQNELSPKFDKNRSICVDSLFFNSDGTIQKVKPTLRGVGLTQASDKIEIDRYSDKSEDGSSIEFIDSLDTFKGWKTILSKKGAWIKYNSVSFGRAKQKTLELKASSYTGGTLQVYLDKIGGTLISEVVLQEGTCSKTVEAKVLKYPKGINNLVVALKEEGVVEIDWIKFKD